MHGVCCYVRDTYYTSKDITPTYTDHGIPVHYTNKTTFNTSGLHYIKFCYGMLHVLTQERYTYTVYTLQRNAHCICIKHICTGK